jgi:hypothetical protein
MIRRSIILFLLIFAFAGIYQMLANSHIQINFNSVFLRIEKTTYQNTNLLQNSLFDEQEPNDLDGISCDIDFPRSKQIFQKYRTNNVFVFFPQVKLIPVSELFIDLPPPLLSV